jgi:hypothetical protein
MPRPDLLVPVASDTKNQFGVDSNKGGRAESKFIQGLGRAQSSTVHVIELSLSKAFGTTIDSSFRAVVAQPIVIHEYL